MHVRNGKTLNDNDPLGNQSDVEYESVTTSVVTVDPPPIRYQAELVSELVSQAPRVYGAPRVFDVYTLLAVTLAFGLLVSGLQLLQTLLITQMTEAIVAVSLFTAAIALCQAIMFGGKRPRLASLVGGPLLLVGSVMTASFYDGNITFALTPWLALSALGVMAGYLGGAVVAGVFLVAENARRLVQRRKIHVAEHDIRFDDLE